MDTFLHSAANMTDSCSSQRDGGSAPDDTPAKRKARRARLTVLGWLIVAGCVLIGLPTMEEVAAKSHSSFLPNNAKSVRAYSLLDREFGAGDTKTIVTVVYSHGSGITAADQHSYQALVARVRQRNTVVGVQHYDASQPGTAMMMSRDREALYLIVGLRTRIGSPQSERDVAWLRHMVDEHPAPAGTQMQVTGDPATSADLTEALQKASTRITGVAIALVSLILWVVYRRFASVLLCLLTMGVSVVFAHGVLAALGLAGLLTVSNYTDAFIIAITLGAGTDYSVFLLSRFREARSNGHDVTDAVSETLRLVRPSLLASAATVVLGAGCMGFTTLPIFSTTGPPMAVAVICTLVVSLTLTPALLELLGARTGAVGVPARDSGWVRVGRAVAANPARILAAGVLPLFLLVGALPFIRITFDTRAAQAADSPSNQGQATLRAHFPRNATTPDYLLIQSTQDLGTTQSLATLNFVASQMRKTNGIQAVLSITQPEGRALKPAELSDQLGRIAKGLTNAQRKLDANAPNIKRLGTGMAELGRNLDQASSGAGTARHGAQALADGLERVSDALGLASGKTHTASDGARRLRDGAVDLATGLQAAHDRTAPAVDGLGAITNALSGDLLCRADPICNRARVGLEAIYRAERDELLPGLANAAHGARAVAAGSSQLTSGLAQLARGLDQIEAGTRRARGASTQLEDGLGRLEDGTQALAAGTDSVLPAMNNLASQSASLTTGLRAASRYLRAAHDHANGPLSGGFYIPPSAMADPSFRQARRAFLSADRHLTRIYFTTKANPISPLGSRAAKQAVERARDALRGTNLEGAKLSTAGSASAGIDLASYSFNDSRIVVVGVLAFVLLILVLTLRALAAPLFLLFSVVLSTAAALGLTTVVFQFMLGRDIQFTAPAITFVLLIAVGADYNILLINRMREGGDRLTKETIADAVAHTGPVITSAGMIFASTFLALLASPIATLNQNGFAVGVGLLIDTFIVRTLIVPAGTALLGDKVWWPRHVVASQPRQTTAAKYGGV